MRQILFIVCALALVFPAFAEKPGWTEYKPDGTIKVRAESEFRDGKIIKTEVFDSGDRLEFVEYPVYGKNGRISKYRRFLPDGSAWPYKYVVYGAASLGGISKVAEDIKMIQETVAKIDAEYPILEIYFLSKDHVEVKTGIVKGPVNASGRYHDLKKEENQWRTADEKRAIRVWVS